MEVFYFIVKLNCFYFLKSYNMMTLTLQATKTTNICRKDTNSKNSPFWCKKNKFSDFLFE